jgi:hypothetical protein
VARAPHLVVARLTQHALLIGEGSDARPIPSNSPADAVFFDPRGLRSAMDRLARLISAEAPLARCWIVCVGATRGQAHRSGKRPTSRVPEASQAQLIPIADRPRRPQPTEAENSATSLSAFELPQERFGCYELTDERGGEQLNRMPVVRCDPSRRYGHPARIAPRPEAGTDAVAEPSLAGSPRGPFALIGVPDKAYWRRESIDRYGWGVIPGYRCGLRLKPEA